MKKRASKSSSAPKTDLRLLRTRKALREGLLSLIQTRSIDDITVRDITSESLVGYNTFFRHYGSKDELVEEIVADEFKQLLERSLPALMEAETKKQRFFFVNTWLRTGNCGPRFWWAEKYITLEAQLQP